MNLFKKKKDVIEELRENGAIIGENVHIINCLMDRTHTHLIKVGNNTTLTHCTVLTHDASTKKPLGKSKIGRVFIGDNCFVGLGSIILPNVTIGNNCIIGAGSVVTKDIPDNSLAAGNPCRVIGRTDEYLKRQKANMEVSPVFSMDCKKFTDSERKIQFEQLKDGGIGYND
ncbi:MAG: acyltransferase [Clostridia bacterium]|nr:acyltransferase [Clostridia bacterium]